MACLTNYTIQCKDVTSGKTGCFIFDELHWQKTGEFKALSGVYPSLDEFYKATSYKDRKSIYIERLL